MEAIPHPAVLSWTKRASTPAPAVPTCSGRWPRVALGTARPLHPGTAPRSGASSNQWEVSAQPLQHRQTIAAEGDLGNQINKWQETPRNKTEKNSDSLLLRAVQKCELTLLALLKQAKVSIFVQSIIKAPSEATLLHTKWVLPPSLVALSDTTALLSHWQSNNRINYPIFSLNQIGWMQLTACNLNELN